jgi:hypothetical protein
MAASMAALRSHARNVNSMSTEAVRHFPELPAVLPPFPYAEITLLCAEGARGLKPRRWLFHQPYHTAKPLIY